MKNHKTDYLGWTIAIGCVFFSGVGLAHISAGDWSWALVFVIDSTVAAWLLSMLFEEHAESRENGE